MYSIFLLLFLRTNNPNKISTKIFFLKYILSLNTINLPSLYLNLAMQTISQKSPFKLIEVDYQWLTHFFETLLLLFEPMLSNPFCLKIISGSS